MTLINVQTRNPINIGDHVITFRDEEVIVEGMREPTHAGSTGRVEVRFVLNDNRREYFPGVIDAVWMA